MADPPPQQRHSDAKILKYLRQKAKAEGLLSAQYDHKYNLLRWAIANNYDIRAAKYNLMRHLRFRRMLKLDSIDEWFEPDHVTSKYFPIGLIGGTGKDNRFVVIEAAGKVDLHGITSSVVSSQFIVTRMAFQEKLLRAMNEAEAATGRQSSIVYIVDLDGLQMDPSLIGIVSGQYRMMWELIYMNYPEWISSMFVINAPAFMKVLWAALSPFIPETTASKIHIYSTPDHWKPVLLEHIAATHLPVYWGGSLVDEQGDTMMRSRICIPSGPVPSSLYWQPNDLTPDKADLPYIGVAPGALAVLSYAVTNNVNTITVVRFCDRSYAMAIRYDERTDTQPQTQQPSQSEEWSPEYLWPSLSSTDRTTFHVPGPGTYHIIFGNEEAWIRTLYIYYRVEFGSSDGSSIRPEPIENSEYAEKFLEWKHTRKQDASEEKPTEQQ